jgi:hypothetical protein
MMRRDQQTGEGGPATRSHWSSTAVASAGLIRFAHAPATTGANGFVLAPTKFRGSRIGFVRWYRAVGSGIGLAAGKLAQSGTNHLDRQPGAGESDAS